MSVTTAPAATVAEKHPKGLTVLFATEMWERFSFYSMLALFTLYLQDATQGFGWDRARAFRLHGLYLGLVYFSPLIGGWIADKKLGYRRSVMIGGFFFMAGHLLLSVRSIPVMYAALACLVVGNGFFKPNVSAMVGKLYPEGSPLKDRAYSIFYMGINIGAFTAPIVMEVVKQKFGYHPAFAVAAFGMAISVFILWKFKKHVEAADAARERGPVPAAQRAPQPIDLVPESRRIAALLVIFGIVVIFWMAFHQNSSTWTAWANDNTDWSASRVTPVIIKVLTLGMISGKSVSGTFSNAINPAWVLILTIPLVRLWGALARRGLEPSTPTKMGIGMFLVSTAYLIMWQGALAGGDTGRVSPWWIICAYGVVTAGELMLSPVGLSLVSKVAPERHRGLMMGGWFAATAIGNYLVGVIGQQWDVWSHSKFFLIVAFLCAGVGLLLFLLLRPLKKAMPGV
jgi:POT family proton-dependent oligopeptide transporter